MSWLAHGGTGFDCASAREVNMVKSLQSPPEIQKAPLSESNHRSKSSAFGPEIIFANPCKKEDDILFSSINNINTTVVDSHEEIDKLANIGWDGSSYIRIRVDDEGSLMPFSAKFGASLEDVKYLATYARIKKQIISGVSFHVGSGCKDPAQYTKAIKEAADAITIINSKGHSANVIDIGGGFTNDGFSRAALAIKKARGIIPSSLRLIAEPGRFFAETSHDLFVRVIGKKPALRGPGYRYTVDESLYGQFSCIPYDHAQPKWIRVREPGELPRKKMPAVLYGRTCDSVDMIAVAQEAEELVEGDWLWFPNMGAYTSVTSTEFNGFPRPPLMVLEAHREDQLPEPSEFIGDWPTGLKYVSPVRVPE